MFVKLKDLNPRMFLIWGFLITAFIISTLAAISASSVSSPKTSINNSIQPVETPLAKDFQIDFSLELAGPVQNSISRAFEATNSARAFQEQQQKPQLILQPAISKPFTITYQDQSLNIPVEKLQKLLKVENETLEIDRGGFGELIKDWGKKFEKTPVNAEIGWSDKQGKVYAIKPGNQGKKINLETTLDQIKEAFQKKESQVPLLMEDTNPVIDSNNLEKLGIKEKISEGVSGYAGSDQNRAKNIELGAGFVDNTPVPPRGIFSFNNAVGPITKERGFADGYAIVGDITEKDVGGGICQVSTTVFRAAFWAGFNIIERHSHAYRVSWYESLGEPTGFDATIYQPGVDFKFKNDTDNWLLVSTYWGGGKLRVVLYGTKPDWKVEMTPGSGDVTNITNPPATRYELDPKMKPGEKKKVDSAHKGFDTFVGRLVKGSNGQVIRQDKFSTHYAAWPEIYKVGSLPTPTPAPPVVALPTTVKPAQVTQAAAAATTVAKSPAGATPSPSSAPPTKTALPVGTTVKPNNVPNTSSNSGSPAPNPPKAS